tara:strand:- start:1283 stop:2341 length:1059 start_codon:yes stop_codon:yes gene_type:complete
MLNKGEEKSVKVAIIGFGKMGILHSALLNAHPDAKVVGIVENDQKTIKLFSQLNNSIKTYSSISDLLEDKLLDGIIISTPTYSHISVLEEFNDLCPYSLIEKPLALNCTEINKRQLSEKLIKKAFVGYVMRFHPAFNKVKLFLLNNLLGNIRSFHSQYYIASALKKLKGWRMDSHTSGGGALITNASHVIDMILWYFGTPNKVNGIKQHIFHKDVEDAYYGIMHYDNGMVGTVITDWCRQKYRIPHMSINIIGAKGEIEVDNNGIKLILYENCSDFTKGIHEIRGTELYEGVYFDIGGQEYSKQIEAYINSIDGKTNNSICSFEEAIVVQRVIDLFYKSSIKDCTPISVPIS